MNRRNPRTADTLRKFERSQVWFDIGRSAEHGMSGRDFLALAAQKYDEDTYLRVVKVMIDTKGLYYFMEDPSSYSLPVRGLLATLRARYSAERAKPLVVEVAKDPRYDFWYAYAYLGDGPTRTEAGFVVAEPSKPVACPKEYARLRRKYGAAPTYEVVSSKVDRFVRGTGLGTRLYRELGERLGATTGAYLFANRCGSSLTSYEAERVYRSLGRIFPSEGLVVYFPPTKTNPRRNGRGGTSADRTDPELWEDVKREVTAGSKGGKPDQWSARKAQLAVALYRQRGGGYWGPKDPRNSLAKWTQEKWRTKSGRPSLETGERYLPTKAIAALTDAEYAATTRAKRAGMRKGQQFVPQPEAVALKVRAYRRNPAMRIVAYLEMNGYWYSATERQWAALVAAGIAGKGWNLDRLTTPLKRRPSSVSANGDSFLPVVRPLDFYEPEEWEEVDAQVRRMQAALARAYRKNTRRRNPHQQGHGIDPRLLAADGARYFSDEALAEADQEAGSSKSRTALVLMRPRDFLAMAEPGMREESQAALERVLDAGVRLSDVPRLFIATPRTDPHRAVVTGHEGRHRSRALLARGVTQMPVRIHSQDIRWGEQTDPESWDYDPVLPSVLVGEGANRHNTLPMPVPLHYPELAPRLRRSLANPRRKR